MWGSCSDCKRTRQTLEDMDRRLARMESLLDQVVKGIQKIMLNEAETLAALQQIDDNTTKIGTNVAAISVNVGLLQTASVTISTEMDDFKTALAAAGVSPALLARATSLAAKTSTMADAAALTKQAADLLVPVLNGIAAKGVVDPVPIAVPDPIAPISILPVAA